MHCPRRGQSHRRLIAKLTPTHAVAETGKHAIDAGCEIPVLVITLRVSCALGMDGTQRQSPAPLEQLVSIASRSRERSACCLLCVVIASAMWNTPC